MAVNIFGLGMQAFDQGYDRTQAIRDQVTRRKAGQRLAAGDRTGASQAFASEGMIPEARQMQADQFAVEDREAGKVKEQQAEAAKRAELLIGAAGALKRLPPEQRRSALSHPIFQMAGLSQDQLAGLTDEDLSDQSLDMFVGTVKRSLQIVNRGDGGYDVVDTDTGDLVRGVEPQRKPLALDPDKTYVLPADAPMATANPDTDRVFEALIAQESGGRAGVLGPETPYGRAEGKTQMLPATAEAMARKVGVPWNAALMRDNTPRGAAYQERLGRAYFEEGLQKYGGDVRKALMYYHGGPNEQLWGPKTRAYADQVLARAGGQDAQAGGTGGDELPGYRVLKRGEPKQEAPPSGYRWTSDGNLEAIPGGPGDPTVRALGTGSKREFASLRKEFNSLDEVKNFKDVAASYRQVRALASRPNASPADDTALTFSFMKMLDPGSVVREGEFALVGRGAGLPDQIVMQLARVDQGKGLTPTIRARLVETAAQIMLQRRAAYDSVASNYRQIAQDLGVNPDQLVEDPAKWRTRIKPQAGASAARRTAGSAGKPSLDDIFK